MKKPNYFAVVFAIISAFSVFLPWFEANTSSSFMGYEGNYSSGGITGVQFSSGIFGLILSASAVYLALKQSKIASIPGLINVIIGIGLVGGMFGSGLNASMSYEYGRAESSVDPQIGLFLFIITSFLFSLFTLKYLWRKEQHIDTLQA